MARMTGGEALLKSLQQYDVDTVFGVPGVQLDSFFNALHDAGNSVRVIHNRHEQGSAYMAYGYAKSTGRPGVYVCVPGAGFLNTAAALSTAYACNAPVLCVTGQIPSGQIGRGLGAHHEIPDQLGQIRGLTKWAGRIDHPGDAPRQVEEAFRALWRGRVRPVGLEMAPDVMASEAVVHLRPPIAREPAEEPDPQLVECAAEMLGAAERPLIAVGGGITGAEEATLAVAEALQAPVCMSRNALGALSDRHYLALREVAANRLWADADVVLAVGTRLYEQYMGWGVDSALRVIRVDIDPTEVARNQEPALAIAADARAFMVALADRIGRHNGHRPSRRPEMEELKAGVEAEFAELEPQIHFVHAIRDALPDDGFVVGESTQMGYAARIALPVYAPNTFITSGYQGTLGFGFATALGVKAGNPDRAVVSISGDGGFMYNVQELATAVQQRIGAVCIVFNDSAYGNIRRAQRLKYGGRIIGSDLHNPDFVRLAEDFGAQGVRAETPDELRAALRQGLAHDGPTLIEVPVGELPSPWHLMHLPRVRGN